MKGRIQFHTPEEIRAHLSNYKKSGLTVAEYCSRAKIAASTFWNWRKKYRSEIPGKSAVSFFRLPTAPVHGSSLFEIVFANNTRLKVPSVFDPDSLKALIAVLR
ncbi:MAG: hypothetical protein JW768_06460 [Chitinispirillaceae bacterium]|nr:hypothetical protein [Chitinispirillaceae bacterium]